MIQIKYAFIQVVYFNKILFLSMIVDYNKTDSLMYCMNKISLSLLLARNSDVFFINWLQWLVISVNLFITFIFKLRIMKITMEKEWCKNSEKDHLYYAKISYNINYILIKVI